MVRLEMRLEVRVRVPVKSEKMRFGLSVSVCPACDPLPLCAHGSLHLVPQLLYSALRGLQGEGEGKGEC